MNNWKVEYFSKLLLSAVLSIVLWTLINMLMLHILNFDKPLLYGLVSWQENAPWQTLGWQAQLYLLLDPLLLIALTVFIFLYLKKSVLNY